jgi:hypothetical protein
MNELCFFNYLVVREIFSGREERFAGLQVAVNVPLVCGILELVLLTATLLNFFPPSMTFKTNKL